MAISCFSDRLGPGSARPSEIFSVCMATRYCALAFLRHF